MNCILIIILAFGVQALHRFLSSITGFDLIYFFFTYVVPRGWLLTEYRNIHMLKLSEKARIRARHAVVQLLMYLR